jgi:hypothetical protein
MPTTFLILKRRWPEVILIVALALFGSLGLRMLEPYAETKPTAVDAIILLGTLLFYISQIILQLGFVRTAYTEADKAQEPAVLFKTGSRFFFRLVLFGMAYAGLYLLLGFVIFLILHEIGFIEAKFLEATAWIRNLCFAASSLILVKVILLPPALIIVRDCGLVESVISIGKFRLLSAREPLVLFIVLQIVTYFTAVLAPVDNSQASGHLFYTITSSLTSALIALAVSLSTVRFIALYEPYEKINIPDRPADVYNIAEKDREAGP